ncbi:hypothetical protein HJG44_20495 [Enterovirga sp. DB1703]|uniref:Uncharacterized protein n=1 Tax=Enterovirga aerilata TaxID=2730920 RepID=A0A849IA52_9HYPH|nr:hypothetical protein [Enterovirga sp. DB1703]
MTAPSPNIINLPSPPDRYERAWMARLLESLRQNIADRLSAQTANGAIFLSSPAGKTFRVTVRDDGTLQTEHVNG